MPSRSEVLLVNAPNNPYIFCIFTKNNKDQRWTHKNEAWAMARKISLFLWNYFEQKIIDICNRSKPDQNHYLKPENKSSFKETNFL